MSHEEWSQRRFEIDAIKTLADAYNSEHDWESDDDPGSTIDLLNDVDALHEKLVADLGDCPELPWMTDAFDDSDLPF